MLSVLVLGANGQLGRCIEDISQEFEFKFIFKSRSDLDITNFQSLEASLSEEMPDFIINCAAYTDVEKAQSDQASVLLVNELGVKNVAQLVKKYNISLVHISTDFVFSGLDNKDNILYEPNDLTDPLNFYGYSKLMGEKQILEISPKNSIIIRTSWLYSEYGRNFVKSIFNAAKTHKNLNVVCDEVGSPTYAPDLARGILSILALLKNETPKIYHYANKGCLSRFEFAKEIVRLAGFDTQVLPIESSQYAMKATRPSFSALSTRRFELDFGVIAPDYILSLKRCISKLKE